MHALIGQDGVRSERISAARIERDLLWREGRLSFERSTLVSAAAEFNRYNSVRITFTDPAIGRRRVTGLFAASDPRGFADAVALTMGLGVKTIGRTIILSDKLSETALGSDTGR